MKHFNKLIFVVLLFLSAGTYADTLYNEFPPSNAMGSMQMNDPSEVPINNNLMNTTAAPNGTTTLTNPIYCVGVNCPNATRSTDHLDR